MHKTKELQELGQWKVGMEVIRHSNLHSSVYKISRITDGRGGSIYVPINDTCREIFDSMDNLRTADTWSQCRIEPLTPERKKELELKIRHNKLCRFNISSLTPEQASEIVLFMREKGIKI